MLQIIALLICFNSFIQVLVSTVNRRVKTLGFVLTVLAIWFVLESWESLAVMPRKY